MKLLKDVLKSYLSGSKELWRSANWI